MRPPSILRPPPTPPPLHDAQHAAPASPNVPRRRSSLPAAVSRPHVQPGEHRTRSPHLAPALPQQSPRAAGGRALAADATIWPVRVSCGRLVAAPARTADSADQPLRLAARRVARVPAARTSRSGVPPRALCGALATHVVSQIARHRSGAALRARARGVSTSHARLPPLERRGTRTNRLRWRCTQFCAEQPGTKCGVAERGIYGSVGHAHAAERGHGRTETAFHDSGRATTGRGAAGAAGAATARAAAAAAAAHVRSGQQAAPALAVLTVRRGAGGAGRAHVVRRVRHVRHAAAAVDAGVHGAAHRGGAGISFGAVRV
ncbi:ribonuclease E [Gracilaria domingensis]|nr:ribonuclease E [Gracilaria domingensis]